MVIKQTPTRNRQQTAIRRPRESRMTFMLIAGARPNFMKVASIIDAIKQHNDSIKNTQLKIQHLLVHTGQHYDDSMSEAFFRDLELPRPDIYLEAGSGSHAVQTAEIMRRFEPVLLEHRPDVVVVVGDVNSTIACGLVASKITYPVSSKRNLPIGNQQRATSNRNRPLIAHVEAGLRSFDRTMPEEINRLLTDAISDILFTTEESGNENLLKEGIAKDKIVFVGNTMIDTLLKHKEISEKSNILSRLGLLSNKSQQETKSQKPTTKNEAVSYGVLTLHRPSNVDHQETFRNILEALKKVAKELPVIFSAHPRTLNRIKEFGFESYFHFPSQPLTHSLQSKACGLHYVEPLGYLDFLCLMSNSRLVLTDSGGMQEETTVLGIPCITLRENTERPVTTTCGTNVLAGVQKEKITKAALSTLRKYDIGSRNVSSNARPATVNARHSSIPPLWDGKAGQRIVDILIDKVGNRWS